MSDPFNPTDCRSRGSSVHWVLQARILAWVAMPSSRGFSQSRDCTHVSYVSCISRRELCYLGSPACMCMHACSGTQSHPNLNHGGNGCGCCSVTPSCPTLCDPMDFSRTGLPVLHHIMEFAQTHIHRIGNAMQPSHPLASPSPPAFNLSRNQGLFQVSQFFTSGGQGIGASASVSVFPVNNQD